MAWRKVGRARIGVIAHRLLFPRRHLRILHTGFGQRQISTCAQQSPGKAPSF